jgi:hypothetical protein
VIFAHIAGIPVEETLPFVVPVLATAFGAIAATVRAGTRGGSMSKYLVLYHAPASAAEQMANATPEEMQAGMDAWMSWANRAGDALVDFGAPLGNGEHVGGSGASSSGSDVSGFSVLQADSRDAVVELLRDHPHLHMPGGSIDVLEFIPMPGG